MTRYGVTPRFRQLSGMRLLVAGASAVLVASIAAACARPAPPPGGPEDILPPLVVSTYPDTFQFVEELNQPIRVDFSEGIAGALGNALDGSVVVSPRTGEVDVKHKGDAIEVEMDGGFREGLVYRVTVLTRITDRFGNSLEDPFEFVFSTGGEFTDNVIAGFSIDRITGRPSPDLQVVARPVGDSTIEHVAYADRNGVFALRYVPAGPYEIFAFEDIDRDGAPSPFEIQGRLAVDLPEADTVAADVIVLLPDTTPAGLATVEHVDSMILRLTTDDFLDPTIGLEGIAVRLEADSAAGEDPPPAPTVLRLLTDSLLGVYEDSVRVALRATQDSARADSLMAAGDTAGAVAILQPPEPAAEFPPFGEPGGSGQPISNVLLDGPLPFQTFVALLDSPIPNELPYRVIVTGLVNVNGVTGGEGERILEGLPRDTTAAVVPDTSGTDLQGFRSHRR